MRLAGRSSNATWPPPGSKPPRRSSVRNPRASRRPGTPSKTRAERDRMSEQPAIDKGYEATGGGGKLNLHVDEFRARAPRGNPHLTSGPDDDLPAGTARLAR